MLTWEAEGQNGHIWESEQQPKEKWPQSSQLVLLVVIVMLQMFAHGPVTSSETFLQIK